MSLLPDLLLPLWILTCEGSHLHLAGVEVRRWEGDGQGIGLWEDSMSISSLEKLKRKLFCSRVISWSDKWGVTTNKCTVMAVGGKRNKRWKLTAYVGAGGMRIPLEWSCCWTGDMVLRNHGLRKNPKGMCTLVFPVQRQYARWCIGSEWTDFLILFWRGTVFVLLQYC